MVTSHFHNALHKYLDAHKALLSQWNEEQLTDNETAVINRQYPFSKSFDDMLSDVQMWVYETCNSLPYRYSGYTGSTSKKYMVLQVLMCGFQPVFSDEDGIMLFDTEEEATTEINDNIAEIKEAIKTGDMSKDSRMTIEDYKVVQVVLNNDTIFATIDNANYSMKRTDDDFTLIEDKAATSLIPAIFATQSSRTVNGYYYESERWNGFYMPLLERSAIETLMQYDKNIAIDANNNVYLEGENDTIAPIEIDGKQLYHFNNGWTWTKYEQPTNINNIEDAKQFIKECVDYVGLSFHPDKMFSEYIDSRTNETLYSDEAAIEANNKLQDCLIEFEVAGQDVYQYALSLL